MEDLIMKEMPMEIRKKRRRRKSRMISYIRTVVELVLVLAVIIGYNYYNGTIDTQSNTIAKTQAELNKTREQIELLLTATSTEEGVTPTIDEAVANAQEMKKELTEFRERKELYDKYEYVLFYQGQRTDMTYDMTKYGENLMEKEKINPNLLFGLIMVESHANEKAQNVSSTARGFCQLLSSTARGIYENVLQKGKYNHKMAFDGYTNIEIGSKLIAMNMEKYNGDTYTVIQRYRGIPDIGSYYAAVDRYVNRGGTSLRQIAKDYPD
jgi:hypothetical protein